MHTHKSPHREYYYLYGGFLFPIVFFILYSNPLSGQEREALLKKDITIIYDNQLESVAEEAAQIYAVVKMDLEETLKWNVTFSPTMVLVGDNQTFQEMTGNSIIVALAVPDRDLIVIDYSRMKTDPFTLEATIKHELCHLLLHKNIHSGSLPKWLDEGVAQWVSGGVVDVIIMNRGPVLNAAILSNRYMDLKTLERVFPSDEKGLALAYAESKYFVEYLVRRYGAEGLLMFLDNLKRGNRIDEAMLKAYSKSFDELEAEWYKRLKKRITWVTFFVNNIYGILFFLSALLLIYAFIRVLIRKKRYGAFEEDSNDFLN